eukprot:gene6873-34669_t
MAVGVELLVPPGDTQAIDGTVFTLELPTASVIAMLPLGLELAPLPLPHLPAAAVTTVNSNLSDKTHPVLLTFCTQLRVGSPFTHFTYREFILTVPYVQWDDAHAARFPNYRGPFAYLPHLYLNETEPVDLGHSYVGDRKEYAHISLDTNESAGIDGNRQHGVFKVTGVNDSHWDPNNTGTKPAGAYPGKAIISAEWTTTGSLQPASKFPALPLPGYQLPNVARWPNDGNWTCLPQNYYPKTAKIAPAYGNVTIFKPFQIGLPTGEFSFAAWQSSSAAAAVVAARSIADGDGADGGGAAEGSGNARGYRIATRWDYTNLPLHPKKTRCDNFNT